MARLFRCARCGIEKDVKEFQPKYDKADRWKPLNKYCRDCLYPPVKDDRSRPFVRIHKRKEAQ